MTNQWETQDSLGDWRRWTADSAAHALEQHANAFHPDIEPEVYQVIAVRPVDALDGERF